MGRFTNYISSILLPKQLVLTFNGKTYQILRSDPGFKDLYDASKQSNLRRLEELLNQYGYIKEAVQSVVLEIKKIAKANNDIEEDDDDCNDEDGDEDDLENQEPETEAYAAAQKEPSRDTPPTRAKNVKKKTFQSCEVSDDGLLVINGVTFNNALSKKIADLHFDGYDIKAYYKLIEKIAKNPQHAIKTGLLDFIAQNDLPITTDGNFLAYKVTRADGYDMHSGKVLYKEGCYVSMDRKDVNDSRGVCSGRGLYFASIGYYGSGYYGENKGSARFLVEVDPADVVSIPTSYKNSKGRCCKMKVVRKINWDVPVPTSTSIIDLKTWEPVKPDPKAVVGNNNRAVEKIGTQRYVKKLPIEFITKLDKYIKGRFAAKVTPTLTNAQKATKAPGVTVSVAQIAEAVLELGYSVIEIDEKPFGDSQIDIKKKKKK